MEKASGFVFAANTTQKTFRNFFSENTKSSEGELLRNKYFLGSAIRALAAVLVVSSGMFSKSLFGGINISRTTAGGFALSGSALAFLSTRNTVLNPNKVSAEKGEWEIINEQAVFQTKGIFTIDAKEAVRNLADDLDVKVNFEDSKKDNSTKISISISEFQNFCQGMDDHLCNREKALESIYDLNIKWEKETQQVDRRKSSSTYVRNEKILDQEIRDSVLDILKNEWKLTSAKFNNEQQLVLSVKEFKVFEIRVNAEEHAKQKMNEFQFGNSDPNTPYLLRKLRAYNIPISQSLALPIAGAFAFSGFTNVPANILEGVKGSVKFLVESYSFMKEKEYDISKKSGILMPLYKTIKYVRERPYGVSQKLGMAFATSRMLEGLTASGYDNVSNFIQSLGNVLSDENVFKFAANMKDVSNSNVSSYMEAMYNFADMMHNAEIVGSGIDGYLFGSGLLLIFAKKILSDVPKKNIGDKSGIKEGGYVYLEQNKDLKINKSTTI